MKKFTFIALILFSISVCAQQEIDRTIRHGGLTREYHLYIPDIYQGNVAVPLLLNLHGMGSNNLQQETYGYFNLIADTANFIICFPNGTYMDTNLRFWNAEFPFFTVDDAGFLLALIDTLYDTYNIDPSRIYCTGMSNGGFMSHTMACRGADKIAAVASVAGTMAVAQYSICSPSRPIPVMEIHGDADNIVEYYGTLLSYLGLNIAIVPVDTLMKMWSTHNGCTGPPQVTDVPDINTADGCTATRYDYSCTGGSSVALYKITGGGHTWPGGFPMPYNGPTNNDFNASKEIWKFLRQYRHPHPILGTADKNYESEIIIYPNPCKEYIHIECKNITGNNCFKLTNISGAIVMSGNINEENKLEINNLPDGVYVLSIIGDKGIMHRKILKF